VKPYNVVPSLIGLMVIMGIFFSVGIAAIGQGREGLPHRLRPVFLLSAFSYLMAASPP
jgi:hypothetical protein